MYHHQLSQGIFHIEQIYTILFIILIGIEWYKM